MENGIGHAVFLISEIVKTTFAITMRTGMNSPFF